MNEFRIRATGKIVTEAEFRASREEAFPVVITPEIADGVEMDVVTASAQPKTDSTQLAVRDGVVQNSDGHWVYKWIITQRDPQIVAIELALAKDEMRQRVNQWREIATFSNFPYDGKLIDCDNLSRSDINGVSGHVALFDEFPDNFPYAWKTADNGYVEIPDVATFKALYKAMSTKGTQNFNRAQQLKMAIEEATMIEQLEELQW